MNKSMKSSLPLAFAGLILGVTLSSCGLLGIGGDEGPCGPEMEKERNFDFSSRPNEFEQGLADGSINTFPGGANTTVFSFRLGFVENVCPDKHIHANAWVSLSPGTRPVVLKVEGLVAWFVLFERRFEMIDENGFNGNTGEGGVGLKQAFGDLPGSYSVSVEVTFSSSGDFNTDLEIAKNTIQALSINTTYHEFKEKAQTNPVGS